MGTLSNRNKKVLGIVGGLVALAVVAAVLVTQAPVGGLLGATTVTITPDNPTIQLGQSITFEVNTLYHKWSVEQSGTVVEITSDTNKKQFTVVGRNPGQAVISVKAYAGTDSTTVTVLAPTPTPVPTATSTPGPTSTPRPTPTGALPIFRY